MSDVYDLIVIGAGPGGLSAGLYGARAKMNTLIIEKDRAGGQIFTTNEVANYPGSIRNASGPSLIARMEEQCEEFGAKRVKDTIEEVKFDDKIKVLKGKKEEYRAKTVVIATGASPRMLNVPGEKELKGKGVSYCATADGESFTDLEVFVVGGGNSACEEAMFLTQFAKKVTILSRSNHLTAAKSVQAKVLGHDKVEVKWNMEITELKGDGKLEAMTLRNLETGEITEFEANKEDGTFGVFIFVGFAPQTKLFDGKIELERGYISTSENMETNVEGIYAAGDCRVKVLRQVVSACGDGAVATVMAEKYIENNFDKECSLV
ncbi:NAD(P)/FAD-dependent oxidoreductase [Tepidibacter hydrothermalis]|uniref:FAD-dependent oxidoreductase n=1 Tax=Tepidibacter hydrothermalis TaxID=3036126 RepID=A0ABY8EBZ6_9FIRM|nr:FAD-dependent oxidoreductase [Tepidibacter hydrothermalis]WFD10458.1 FAD-dependent oxidoreductase [Tepidibacter hydrothermalis]